MAKDPKFQRNLSAKHQNFPAKHKKINCYIVCLMQAIFYIYQKARLKKLF